MKLQEFVGIFVISKMFLIFIQTTSVVYILLLYRNALQIIYSNLDGYYFQFFIIMGQNLKNFHAQQFCGHISLDKCLEVELHYCVKKRDLTLQKLENSLSKWMHHFTVLPAMCQSSSVFKNLYLILPTVIMIANLNGWLVISH